MISELKKDKSFRFELIHIKTGLIKEHFNLIYPPESYTIKEAPRHNIMKLFSDDDNLDIQDFGDDNKVITIKGTTGSPDKIGGYKDFTFRRYSGQDAMKEFRDIVINWRKDIKKKRQSIDDYIIKLYNFFDEEVYTVFITSFQMEKTATKPLFYVYSIEMITVDPKKRNRYFISALQDIVDKAQGALDTLDDAVLEIERQLSDNVVVNTIKDIKQLSEDTLSMSRQLHDTISGALSIVPNLISENLKNITDTMNNFGIMWEEFVSKQDGEDYWNIFHPFVQSCKSAQREWNKLIYYRKYYYYTSKRVGLKKGITFEEYLNIGKSHNENILSAEIKQSSGKSISEVSRLAREKYGVDLTGPDIAHINDLDTMDVPDGTKIMVPISEDIIVNMENQVITDDKLNDVMGVDISLSENGNFIPGSDGDLLSVSDIENMKQAINHVLSTEFNAFITLDNYGFDAKHTIGQAGVSDFLNTIKLKYVEAISRDPRIVSVNDISLIVDKGKVEIHGIIVLLMGKFEHVYTL